MTLQIGLGYMVLRGATSMMALPFKRLGRIAQGVFWLCFLVGLAEESLCLDSECISASGFTLTRALEGELKVTSNPGKATVLLDDEYKGETPITISRISEGYHILVVRKEGYLDYETTLEIKRGIQTTREVILQRPGVIEVRSNIPEAEVFLNDELQQGKIPITVKNLRPQEYLVKVRSPGFEEFKKSVNLVEGGFEVVEAKLKGSAPLPPDKAKDASPGSHSKSPDPAPRDPQIFAGFLTVTVVPENAEVYVDGKKIRDGPIQRQKIAAGDHMVQVRHPSKAYAPTERIVVAPQTEVKLEGRLGVFSAKPLLRSTVVPGLGQIMNGSSLKGLLFLVGVAGGGAYSYFTHVDYTKKTDAYKSTLADYTSATTVPEATRLGGELRKKYSELDQARKKRDLVMLVTSAIYALNLFDTLLFESSISEIVTVSQNNPHRGSSIPSLRNDPGINVSFAVSF